MPLIVLEGIDGAGTTTQAERLTRALEDRGYRAHATREPSDGPVGRLLREVLSGKHAPVEATTLGLLFAADRADHIQREVMPVLRRGEVVVSDRWYHSSLAYQGTEEDRAWIRQINERALVPDLILLLRVAPEVAAKRRSDAGRSDEIFDRIETQRQVAAGYDAVVAELGDREPICVIDGERDADTIAAEILALALEACGA